MEKQLRDTCTEKYDWLLPLGIAGTVAGVGVNIANFLNRTVQSTNMLVVMSPKDIVLTIMVIIMWKVPVLKPYISLILTTGHGLASAIFFNLANRDMLPYPVDMTNLDFFSASIQTSFIWQNCLFFHDIKWFLFFHGPMFLAASYFEAVAIIASESNGDPNYGKGKILLKMFKAS